MMATKPIRLLLAVPAACTLLFFGLDIWYGSEANRLAGAPNKHDVCSMYSPQRPVRDRCESRSRSELAATASGALLAILIAAYLAVNWLTTLVWSGKLPFLTGCKCGYRIALYASSAALIVFMAVLYPMVFLLTLMRFLGIYWLELDNFMIGICLLSASAGLVAFLRRDPVSAVPQEVSLSGEVTTEREQPHLYQAIQHIARSIECTVPTNVVLGLEPGVICTARRVSVGGTVLTGGTLYVSLLYYRLLSESELMSLVTIALVPVQIVSEESENWVIATEQRWAGRHRRIQQSTFPVVGIAMALVWYWLDLWNGWQANINGFAIRRAAVLAGRENVAAALSKSEVLSQRWPSFLTEIQASIRRSEVQPLQLNLSSVFCTRMIGLSDELANDVVIEPWASGLGVDAHEIKRRVGDMQPSRPAEWLGGVESLENKLSAAQINSMVFLRKPID